MVFFNMFINSRSIAHRGACQSASADGGAIVTFRTPDHHALAVVGMVLVVAPAAN